MTISKQKNKRFSDVKHGFLENKENDQKFKNVWQE